MKLDGISGLRAALDAAARKTADGVERGVVKAALVLQRESQLRVPVDTGALRNSAFTRKEGSGVNTAAVVGYTQAYAVVVHEDLEAHHPVGEAKYLERPARELAPELAAIIAAEARS